MSEMERKGTWCVDDRRQALVATLPPLLFGAGIALSAAMMAKPWYSMPTWRLGLAIALGLIPAAVIAGGGIAALVRRLPDWGYTWVGAALMGFALLIQAIAEERAEIGEPLISPTADIVVGVLVLLAGLAVLIVVALRGWKQAGLVSLGLATILGLSVCSAVARAPFYRQDLALLAGPLGLLIAALIYIYVQASDAGRVAVLVSVGLLNAGAAWMADQAWQTWLLEHGKPSPLFPLLVLLTGALLAGPLLGLFVRPLRRVFRRA